MARAVVRAGMSRHFVQSPHVGSHRMVGSLYGSAVGPRNHADLRVQ